jgi:hypothetical protein
MSLMRLRFVRKGTATTYLSGISYNTRIGNGVDANGYANLPLRAGATRYYVGNGGSDAADGLTHATRLATVDAGLAKVVQNNGDQVVVAEGSTFATKFPYINNKHGFSRLYPTVIQSYNPSFPTDETRMGRATGSNRPSFTADMSGGWTILGAATSPMQNLVIRGFDINPGNVAGQSIFLTGSNGLSPHGILIENNLFRYTMVTVGSTKGRLTTARDIVIRGNSFFGAWNAGNFVQGLYMSGMWTGTLEDNVFWHNGWKVGGSRDDTAVNGGPTIFNHNLYFQDDSAGIIRRNLAMEGGATGFSARGHVDITGNVSIKNPIALIGGLGSQYNSLQPYGVAVFQGFNAVLDSEDLNSTNARGSAFYVGNGKQGSAVHHNLAAQGRNGAAGPAETFLNNANYAMPSYVDFHDNLGYLWSASGAAVAVSGNSGAGDGNNYSTWASTYQTFANNWWDDPASGSNLNRTSKAIATGYTPTTLYTALGFANEAAAFSAWYLNPDTKPARTIRDTLFTGYSLPTAGALKNLLLANNWFMADGNTVECLVMGVQDGSTLTGNSLPSGFTLDGPNHILSYNGTGTPTTGTLSITETPVGGSPKTSSVPYQIVASKAAPVLSSPSSARISGTSLTFSVNTDTADGTIYWIVAASAFVPEWQFLPDGLDGTHTRLPTNQFGSVAVSSTGTKTVTVTSLTAGTTYHIFVTHADSLWQNSNVLQPADVTT